MQSGSASSAWQAAGSCLCVQVRGKDCKTSLTPTDLGLILARSSKPCRQIGRLLKPTMASPHGAGRCVSDHDDVSIQALCFGGARRPKLSTTPGVMGIGSLLSRTVASAAIGTTSRGLRMRAYSALRFGAERSRQSHVVAASLGTVIHFARLLSICSWASANGERRPTSSRRAVVPFSRTAAIGIRPVLGRVYGTCFAVE